MMTRGLPDYYRGVDIAYQALAQMIVRPKYGGANSVLGGAVISANAVTTLVTLNGKGMIYGGVVFLDYTSSQKTGFFILKVDGSKIADMTIENLNKFGVNKSWAYSLYLLKYDDVDFIYSAGVSYGITFETSFELAYEEQEGNTPLVLYDLTYAVI